MTSQLPAGCRQILELQAGVITRGQALGAGLSRHSLAARLDSRHWQRLHTGVYAAFTGRPDREVLQWAAVLGAGPRAVLSYQSAAGVARYEDVRYRRYRLIVELDGQAAHPDGERWRDIHRDNASTADGCVTLRYSWSDVTQRPCAVAAEVGRVLGSRGWSGQPRPCGPDCTIQG